MAEFTAAEYAAYVRKYPDLVAAKPAGMSNAAWGKKHWDAHGEKNASRSTPGVAAGNDEDVSNKPDASGYSPIEYQQYVQKYPDLVAAKPAGMTDSEWGKKHWAEHGSKNASRLTPTRAKTSEWWGKTTAGPSGTGVALEGLTKYSDDQYLNYVLANPDLRELSEALGLTQSETIKMGQQHWGTFGADVGGTAENRQIGILNALDHIKDNKDFSAGSQDASEAYIQRITQNAPGSQMWDARTGISPDWRLNQFTGAGWNMAADQPYQTGLLGDTLEVNEDIGQLVPTAAGNQRFLQDRYVDDSIANDFPIGWTTPQNTWAGPEQLGNYWDVLTNATRDATGILGRVDPYDPNTAVGPSVSPGSRGGGNIRTDPGRYVPPGGGGLLNPTVPTFRGPGYQDWTRFMPTDFQLAEGGGRHYQQFVNPYMTGSYENDVVYGPILTPPGGGTGGGTGGGFTGVNTGGNNSGVTTDASGNRWVMTPQGNWVPATSEYGEGLLGTGRLHGDPNFYDSSGAFVGHEGNSYDKMGFEIDNKTGLRTGAKINDSLGIGNTVLGWMGAWPAEVQHAKNAFNAGLTPGQQSAMAAAQAAEAGTGFADIYGGGEDDPTSGGFVDWDQ